MAHVQAVAVSENSLMTLSADTHGTNARKTLLVYVAFTVTKSVRIDA